MPWWKRMARWMRRWFARFGQVQPRLPAKRSLPWKRADDLSARVRDELARVDVPRGVVHDTIANAIEDFCDLSDVVVGSRAASAPGSLGDVVDDVSLLADAEDQLLSLIERAQGVDSLINIATRRRGHQPGREAAGEAILRLRDDARALTNVAAAAMRWAASREVADRDALQESHQQLLRRGRT